VRSTIRKLEGRALRISSGLGWDIRTRRMVATFANGTPVECVGVDTHEPYLPSRRAAERNERFVGTDEAATVNTTVVWLLASCALHQLEPCDYLRDLLCLLPGWRSAGSWARDCFLGKDPRAAGRSGAARR
jgi:hypothetical protein